MSACCQGGAGKPVTFLFSSGLLWSVPSFAIFRRQKNQQNACRRDTHKHPTCFSFCPFNPVRKTASASPSAPKPNDKRVKPLGEKGPGLSSNRPLSPFFPPSKLMADRSLPSSLGSHRVFFLFFGGHSCMKRHGLKTKNVQVKDCMKRSTVRVGAKR